jgi:hypothetical protein
MPLEQFSALVILLPNIEDAIKKKGAILARPDYATFKGNGDEKPGMKNESGEHNAGKSNNTRNSARASRMGAPLKKNIEATSDEDEGDE